MDVKDFIGIKRIGTDRHAIAEDLYRIASFAFIFIFAIGIAQMILRSSTFQLGILQATGKGFILVFSAVTVVKSVLLLVARNGKPDLKRTVSGLALAVCIAAVFCAVYFNLRAAEGFPENNRYLMLLFIAISVVGTVGTDHRKLIRIYVILASFLIAVTVCAAIIGAIPNYVYLQEGQIRSSWGIGYPTDMASYFFYICVFYWVAYCRKNDLISIIPAVFALLIAHFIARSETSTFCDIALLIVIILNHFFAQGRLKKTRRMAEVVAVWAFPAFTLLMLALMFAYSKGNGIAIRIDGITSGRIALAVNAYNKYGLSLLGAPLLQKGAGGGNFAVGEGYDFVDSTYPLLMLNYGIVMLVMVNVLWVLMTRKAVRTGDRRLAFGMALIAFHSLSEHHFIEPYYNVLIAMPVTVLMAKTVVEKERMKEMPEQKQETMIRRPEPGMIIAAVMTLIVLAATARRLLPWARTVFYCSGLTDSSFGRKILFAAINALLLGAALMLYCIYKIIAALYTKQEKITIKKYGVVLLLIIVAAIGSLWKINDWLSEAYEERAGIVTSDQDAIDIIKEAHGKLYVYGMPEFYLREYGGISTSLFDGEELARYKNITVVTDKDLESPIFFGEGFLYAPVSEHHSIYTNDEAVIKALEEKGYKLHGYYCIPSYVDLRYEAELNRLKYTAGEPLCLSGDDGALIKGPYYDLRNGRYTLTFDLALDKSSVEKRADDTEIAVIKVTKKEGKEEILSAPVIIDQFDEEGIGRVEAVYSIPDSSAVEFKILPLEGTSLYVRSIENKKTPEYDSRRVYDSKGWIIHEEYYDLDGNVITLASGYAAKDIGYDKEGRVIREDFFDINGEPCNCTGGYAATTFEYEIEGFIIQRYYDIADDPVLNINGFASIKRKKDNIGRTVWEEYYGLDGNPVAIGGGQVVMTEYEFEGNSLTPAKVRYYDKNGNLIE